MVLTTPALRLFAFVHEHFLRTDRLPHRCGAQAPARSHPDARRWRRRWRRTRWTWRTRRQLGWRRLGRGRWRRGRLRRKLGFEDPRRPDRGLHRAHWARGDWQLGSQRPASWSSLLGDRSPPSAREQPHIGAVNSRVQPAVFVLATRHLVHGRCGSELLGGCSETPVCPRQLGGPGLDDDPRRALSGHGRYRQGSVRLASELTMLIGCGESGDLAAPSGVQPALVHGP
jgi:hypothetical protein